MADVPTVSIIVPTFARRAQLKRCLDGIVGLAVAEASFEVIVVDDGGPEPLDVLVASYAERLDVRLIRQSRAGPAAARNVGAAVARGRFLAFIDDDCRPEPGWLPAMIRELKQDDRRLLGGLVENALTKNPYATASEHISRFVYEYGQMAVVNPPRTRSSAIVGPPTGSPSHMSPPWSCITLTTSRWPASSGSISTMDAASSRFA